GGIAGEVVERAPLHRKRGRIDRGDPVADDHERHIAGYRRTGQRVEGQVLVARVHDNRVVDPDKIDRTDDARTREQRQRVSSYAGKKKIAMGPRLSVMRPELTTERVLVAAPPATNTP